LLNKYDEVPFPVIQYLGAVINYGGRVTDDKDKRLIEYILKGYMHPQALEDNYKLSSLDTYKILPACTHAEYYNHFDTLPLATKSVVFGLH
jgi:dynein heavy chain